MENEKYENLLKIYKEIPEKNVSLSIFDVAGYPNYENVCSNILQFYLNPFNEHGLGSLLLKSIFDLLKDFDFIDPKSIEVYREYPTDNGGRIDLVILTNDYIIGIENKIFHILNNDLADYEKTLNNISKTDNLKVMKIVLALKKLKTTNGFISITYRDLWEKIRSNLGYYTSNSSQKWLLYLIDFMNTIENLLGGKLELTEKEMFMVENDDLISKMIQDRNQFHIRLRNQVSSLRDIMNLDQTQNCIKQWIYAKTCLVHDFKHKSYDISFDLYIEPKGWILQLFGRNPKSAKFLDELIKKEYLIIDSSQKTETRYIVEEFALTDKLDDISSQLYKWFERLNKAFKASL